MIPIFKVGELCILQNSGRFNGEEVVVAGDLRWRPTQRMSGEIERCEVYVVRLKDGDMRAAAPFQLRKKRPPREDLAKVNWKSCVWKPPGVIA